MALDEAGLEQAAILLMTVGEEDAAEVFKFLSPKEVQKLGETMARLKTVPREKVEAVVTAFNKTKDEQFSLVGDTDAFVSQVLRRALGEEKANMLLDRILQGRDWQKPIALPVIADFDWPRPDSRREFLRARLARNGDGRTVVQIYPNQDSGVLTSTVWADGFVEVAENRLRGCDADAVWVADFVNGCGTCRVEQDASVTAMAHSHRRSQKIVFIGFRFCLPGSIIRHRTVFQFQARPLVGLRFF